MRRKATIWANEIEEFSIVKERKKYLPAISKGNPAFVIGTGRSGTHWIGYSLGSHPEIRATIEIEPIFRLSTTMALNPSLEKKLFWRLVLAYRYQILKSYPRLYLDKSHPNIWLAEKLKAAFPKSLFIGMERNPYATVASMMKHKGVSAWHRRWREFPIPNRFLGITPELAEHYDDIPLAAQCAMRWVAHHARMNDLKNILGSDLFVISYELFAHDPVTITSELQKFLGLQTPIPAPDVKMDSLRKWESQLSEEEVKQIQSIVDFPPDAFKIDKTYQALGNE